MRKARNFAMMSIAVCLFAFALWWAHWLTQPTYPVNNSPLCAYVPTAVYCMNKYYKGEGVYPYSLHQVLPRWRERLTYWSDTMRIYVSEDRQILICFNLAKTFNGDIPKKCSRDDLYCKAGTISVANNWINNSTLQVYVKGETLRTHGDYLTVSPETTFFQLE